LNRRHKRFDKVVVLLPAHANVLPADIDRVVQQPFVICPRIKQDWKALLRRDAAESGVERHFANGNAHAARTLIAETEDALPVAYDDATHIVVAGIGKNLIDPMAIGIADEQPARSAPDLRKALATLSNRRRVHHGKKIFSVVLDHGVEQRLIVVLEIAHVAVFAEGRVARIQNALASQALIFKRANMRREQAMQPEGVALLFGESRAFIQP
jgi:hypothetical protein